MKNSRRVVITGLGVVAPNGIGKETFWQNLIAGKSAVDYITAFDASPYPCQVAAEVRDFDPKAFMHVRRTKHRGRFSQFAVAAAKLAHKRRIYRPCNRTTAAGFGLPRELDEWLGRRL